MTRGTRSLTFPVRDYDLAATLASGQAFRWRRCESAWGAPGSNRTSSPAMNRMTMVGRVCPSAPIDEGGRQPARWDRRALPCSSWEGVIGPRWVRLGQANGAITAEIATPTGDWRWLTDYLQLETDLAAVLNTFPKDEPMRAAVAACRGLRLLRQDPWECLASFILSSTKQIVQIQQIVALLCQRFGEAVAVPAGHPPAYAFPSFARLASCSEADLRACKMGFRAPYLLGTARMLAEGSLRLDELASLPCAGARAQLLRLPGVGRKIADCVLLFAYGFQEAFPIDVWVMRALRQLYFPRRRVSAKRLQQFSAEHFGPNGGYAQQYLFHYMRTQRERPHAST